MKRILQGIIWCLGVAAVVALVFYGARRVHGEGQRVDAGRQVQFHRLFRVHRLLLQLVDFFLHLLFEFRIHFFLLSYVVQG